MVGYCVSDVTSNVKAYFIIAKKKLKYCRLSVFKHLALRSELVSLQQEATSPSSLQQQETAVCAGLYDINSICESTTNAEMYLIVN